MSAPEEIPTLKTLAFKPIKTYSDRELDFAVKYAEENIPGFYDLLRGVDAYFERRKRKENGTYSKPD